MERKRLERGLEIKAFMIYNISKLVHTMAQHNTSQNRK